LIALAYLLKSVANGGLGVLVVLIGSIEIIVSIGFNL